MIRVFIADDHAILRAGIAALIENEEDMEMVGEAADGREAFERIVSSDIDVALIDLEMPVQSGMVTIEKLRESAPSVRCIALTMYQDRTHVSAVLGVGAAAFMAKHVADVELIEGIRRVARGSTFLCLVEGGHETVQEKTHSDVDMANLSKREIEVLELLVLGHTNREIASKLRLSVKSIETYRSRIAQKVGVRTRAELVRHTIETGFLQRLVWDGRVRD